jgi:hypothetical protein
VAFELGVDPDFLDELHGGQKEVLQNPSLVLVEIVDGIESLWGIIAQVAQDFTDVSPVFLLDVGVVVFFYRGVHE